ncbi:MAG: choice-of-anchor L domain-containing protein, partial [Verrucomicrobia bacterium]|nr:choice-of-anchor L domain-containing protein [Verrucomicrobiota bacterium]
MVSEEGSSAYSNGVVICTVGTMGVGSVATVTNRVIPTQSGLMTNTVVTSSHQTDLNPVNSTPTVVARGLEAVGADLTLNLSASPEPVAGGQVITYTLTVSNRGPGVATNVMVTNFLSSGVQLLLATVSQGTYYQVGSNLIFPVGNLAASGSFSAVILGRTLAAGTITNTTSVGSDTQDVTPDNTMTVVSHVLVAADLKLVVVAPAYAGLSGQVAYMLTVANKGPNDVTNVTLFDTLPSQFGFVSASNSQGSFVNSGNLLVFNLGTILSGSQASAMITAAPITVGVFTNQASVISELMDPDPSNNMISSATTVSSGSSGGSSNGIIVVRNTDAATLASIVTAAGSMGIQVTSSRLQANTIGNGAASSGLYYIGVPPYTYNLTVPGIILSTGDVMDYQTGPNLSSAKTTGYGIKATSEQQALLDPITGSGTQHYSHYDVTQLDIQFDMLPGFNQVKFNVVFGSEEYPFYVHSSFIDGFGIYLNGVNIAYTDGLPVNINHPA